MSKQVTIAGKLFELDLPYQPGHVCTDAEAKTLNQTRAENIRNNLAKHIKEIQESGSVTVDGTEYTDGQVLVNDYAASYEFAAGGGGGGSGRVTDPVDREAMSLAKLKIKEMLDEQGKTVKAFYETDTDEGKERYKAKVAEFAAHPEIRKVAEDIVKRQKKALSGLSLAPVE